jgi:glycosyltransferase involved in cell wall biosynthesis
MSRKSPAKNGREADVNEPANILYCESNVDGTIGGSHYCLLSLVENLDRTKFTPTVTFYENHALLSRFRTSAETLVLPRAKTKRWGLGPARRAVNLVKFVQRVFDRAAFLKANSIALVHQNNSVTRHHDWMLGALLRGVPYVVHERGICDRYSWLDRQLSRRAALVIPMSKAIMDHMVARGISPTNVRVLYDGLDSSRVKPARAQEALRREYGIRDDQPVIGIVGNVREWKGQETVVRALIPALKAHPDAVCFFVGAASAGDEAYQQRLNDLINEAGIAGNVRFTGYQADPASFVNMMSIVMHASILPEPFGMVVLEAMAQGKPIIGSRAGGVVEMVIDGKTGYTFLPGDSAELARRLIELLSDPASAARMGAAGHERLIQSFTIRQFMGGIHEFYRSILSGRPIPDGVGIASDAAAVRVREA